MQNNRVIHLLSTFSQTATVTRRNGTVRVRMTNLRRIQPPKGYSVLKDGCLADEPSETSQQVAFRIESLATFFIVHHTHGWRLSRRFRHNARLHNVLESDSRAAHGAERKLNRGPDNKVSFQAVCGASENSEAMPTKVAKDTFFEPCGSGNLDRTAAPFT